MGRDIRGPLALLSLVGVFSYAFILLFQSHRAEDVPAWMAALVALIVGHYFGSKNEVAHRDMARDEARDVVRDEARDIARDVAIHSKQEEAP